MNTKIKNMTEGNPSSLILSFALSLMAGNVFQQLYTVVDTMVVGKVLGVNHPLPLVYQNLTVSLIVLTLNPFSYFFFFLFFLPLLHLPLIQNRICFMDYFFHIIRHFVQTCALPI